MTKKRAVSFVLAALLLFNHTAAVFAEGLNKSSGTFEGTTENTGTGVFDTYNEVSSQDETLPQTEETGEHDEVPPQTDDSLTTDDVFAGEKENTSGDTEEVLPEEKPDENNGYLWTTIDDGELSSENPPEKLRALFFISVTEEDALKRFYEEPLLYESEYVDTVLLDTGHASLEEITQAREDAWELYGIEEDRIAYCYEQDREIMDAYAAYTEDRDIPEGAAFFVLLDSENGEAAFGAEEEEDLFNAEEIAEVGAPDREEEVEERDIVRDCAEKVRELSFADLEAPKELTVNENNTENIILCWRRVDNAAGYAIYVSSQRDGDYECIERVEETGSEDEVFIWNHQVVPDEAGVNPVCYYRIRALDKYGVEGESFSETATNEGMKQDVFVLANAGEEKAVVLSVFDSLDGGGGYRFCEEFDTLQQAFAEIDSLRDLDARYQIVLREGAEATEYSETLTFPTWASETVIKSEVSGDAAEDTRQTIFYKNMITLKSDVVFQNIKLSPEQADNSFALGNYRLELDNCKVVDKENNEMQISRATGSAASDFILKNMQSAHITIGDMNIGSLHINGSALEISGNLTLGNIWMLGSKTKDGELAAGELTVGGNVTVSSNAWLSDSRMNAAGRTVFHRITLSGNAETAIRAEKDFTINGTLTSMTDRACLYTRQRGEGQAPYLNVAGTVALENPAKDKIHVGVYPAVKNENEPSVNESPVILRGEQGAASQLLTARTASAAMFVPHTENVDGAEEYRLGIAAENHYMLRKSGTAIYVDDAGRITAALCKGDTVSKETADVLGYYITVQDAVAAIDALRDKTEAYTLILLKDAGSRTIPVTLNLPTYASKVTIAGSLPPSGPEETADSTALSVEDTQADRQKIYYVNNISLRSDTVFRGVEFCPMTARGTGAALGFTTGANDLTFKDVSVGTAGGGVSALSYITGNTGKTVTFEDSSLEFTGNITSCGRLVIKDDKKQPDKAELTVNGSLNVQNLELMGDVTLDAKGTVTLTNVINEGTKENRIVYCRTARDTTNLTINGTVSGSNEILLTLEMVLPGEKTESDYALAVDTTEVRVVLSEAKKLANMAKAPTSAIAFRLVDEEGRETEPGVSGQVVKANRGLYLTPADDPRITGNLAEVTDGEGRRTVCLDLTQAVNEINTLADRTAEYTISVGDVEDTNLTDSGRYSAFTLPGNHTAQSVTLRGKARAQDGASSEEGAGSTKRAEITFTGSITAYGNLTIQDILLHPVKSASSGDAADCNLTLYQSGTKESSLYLRNVSTYSGKKEAGEEETCHIGTFQGVRDVTDVELTDSMLQIQRGMSNVRTLKLEDTALVTSGNVVLGDLELRGDSHWDALGTVTLENINAYQLRTGSYLASKQAVRTLLPQFTVKGEVNVPILWKVIEAGTENNEISSGYEEVGLAVAPKASADKFIAFSYGKIDEAAGAAAIDTARIPESDWVSYKNKNNRVMNGDKKNMAVRITKNDTDVTYAESFDEAVALINNAADRTAHYTLKLLKDVGSQTAPVTLNLPTYAAEVIVDGSELSYISEEEAYNGDYDNKARKKIYYVNNISLRSDTVFRDVEFCPVTTRGAGAALGFSTGANDLTLEDVSVGTEEEGLPAGMALSNIAGSGSQTTTLDSEGLRLTGSVTYSQKLVVKKNTEITGTLSVTELELPGTVLLKTGATTVITNLHMENGAGLEAQGNATITNTWLTDSKLTISGRGIFTNISLSGNSESAIRVEKDFNINGTLTSATSEAYLYTSRRGENQAPYLNVSGTVTLRNPDTDRLHVGVYEAPGKTDSAPDSVRPMAKLENRTKTATDVSSQLLTVRTASADMFVPCEENLLPVAGLSGEKEEYILRKSGTAVYVLYMKDMAAALCKGDAVSEETADVLGYYITVQDAVAAIDTLRDKSAVYTLMLLKDVGSQTTPVTLNLPTYASKVTIAGSLPPSGSEETVNSPALSAEDTQADRRKIYYVNNISLRSDTVFRDVEFCPVTTRGTGAALGFTTGANDLTFEDVSVGTAWGGVSALSYITGNTGKTVTFEDSSLEFTGNITSCGRLVIKDDKKESDKAELTVNGSLNVQNLELMGDVTLDAKGAITIANVINEDTESTEGTGENRIRYGRTARDTTNLTINGTVSGSNEIPLTLEMVLPGEKTESDYALAVDTTEVRVVLPEAKKLVNMAKAPTSAIAFRLVDEEGRETEPGVSGQMVKANRGLYLTPADDPRITGNLAEVTDEEGRRTVCLDLTQAVNEINTLADRTADYIISVGDIKDTNLTDTGRYSAFTLPGNHTAQSVTLRGRTDAQGGAVNREGAGSIERAEITFTGSITAYGNLTIQDILLHPVKSASSGDAADCNLTLYQSGTKESSLYLRNVSMYSGKKEAGEEEACHIGMFQGVRDVTDVELTDSTLQIQRGMSNVRTLKLEDTALVTSGNVVLGDLELKGDSHWTALGAATVENVWAAQAGRESYLAAKQAARTFLPQFTIKGEVDVPVFWKVIRADAQIDINKQIDTETIDAACVDGVDAAAPDKAAAYRDVGLAAAPKASADRFVAWPYRTTYKADSEWISYKDKNNYVKNGRRSDMAVCITKNDTDVTYAKSFDEAVAIINNAADMTADYEIHFMAAAGTEEKPTFVTTTADDKQKAGSLTLPVKAAHVTVNSEGNTVLKYTGALTPRCDVTFENIILTEVQRDGIQPSYVISPALNAGDYSLTFGENTGTLKDPQETDKDIKNADLVFGSTRVSRGNLYLNDRIVYVKDTAANIANLHMSGTSLKIQGNATIANTWMKDSELTIGGKGTFTNVSLSGSGRTTIWVDKDFNINGTLTSMTPEAYLYTRQRGEGQAPYLNVNGTVLLQNVVKHRIHVGILKNGDGRSMPKLENRTGAATDAASQLLTARTAQVGMFVPCRENLLSEEVPFSLNAEDGYILRKVGTSIYVSYGKDIVAALCKGKTESTETAGNAEKLNVLGYYISFQDAVTAIDALRDKSAAYTVILLKDVGLDRKEEGKIVPVTLNLPTYASEVLVDGTWLSHTPEAPVDETTSDGNTSRKIYYVNNISLRSNTVFRGVEFCPMTARGAKAALGFTTGAYDLAFENVSVGAGAEGDGAPAGMALSNITGNSGKTVTFEDSSLEFTGNITSCGRLVIKNNKIEPDKTELTVNGSLNVQNLELMGDVTLETKGAVTLANVKNEGTGENRILYGRTARDATNMTINGTISGANEKTLILGMILPEEKAKSNYVLAMDTVKVTLSEAKKLANIAKAPTSAIDFRLLDDTSGETEQGEAGQAVKASRGLYLVSLDETDPMYKKVENSLTELIREDVLQDGTVTESMRTVCLDLTQTVNEINILADRTARYTISVGDIEDTNLTDSGKYSALTLPGNNMAHSVTLRGKTDAQGRSASEEGAGGTKRAEIWFTGSITSYGNLTIQDILLHPVRSAASDAAADFNFTLYQSGTKESSLHLENVAAYSGGKGTDETEECHLGLLQGVRNVTDVTLSNSSLWIPRGISNIGKLTLENTELVTGGNVTLGDLILKKDFQWDALGAVTVENVEVSGAGEQSYLATKQRAGTLFPQFTIKGEVNAPIFWKVIKANAAANEIKYIVRYEDAGLAIAPKASADKFVAWPYKDRYEATKGAEGDNVGDWISYKDKNNYVRNGIKGNMAVRITKGGSEDTYAKSFEEAVTLINNAADMTADYEIHFMKQSGTQVNPAIVTTGENGAVRALTLPTKAAQVTVNGNENTVLQYTGTLIPRCDVTFENILLTEGSIQRNEFVPSYAVTPAVSAGNYRLMFGEGAGTLKNPQETDAQIKDSQADLVFTSVNAPRGSIALYGKSVYVKNTASIVNLQTTGNSIVRSLKSMNLTNIEGSGTLTLDIGFTTIARAGQNPLTQLSIAGNINGVNVDIVPRMYDPDTKSYHVMTAEEAKKLDVQAGKTPVQNQKIAAFAKAAAENIRIFYEEDGEKKELSGYTPYKYEGGLYVTSQTMAVRLVGYREELSDTQTQVYAAEFLDLAQAFKEIDRIADNTVSYEILLQKDMGGIGGAEAPITMPVLPYRAKELRIASAGNSAHNIFFTGGTIALRCDTAFENVGLLAVKRVGSGQNIHYDSAIYNISAGNYRLCQSEMNTNVRINGTTYSGVPDTVSGGANGSYLFMPKENETDLSTQEITPAESGAALLVQEIAGRITGFKTVVIQGTESGLRVPKGISGTADLTLSGQVDCPDGDVSVTDLELENGSIAAKNITVRGMTTLRGGTIKAGTSTVGDGGCTLNQISVSGEGSRIEAKQDRNGVSRLIVNGTVEAVPGSDEESQAPVIAVGVLRYNDITEYAPLENRMVLLTAPKAFSSWFRPIYTEAESPGMGEETEGCTVFKTGRTISYGLEDTMGARLYMTGTDGAVQSSLFAAYEEAVAEIDTLNLYKAGTRVYEDYRIELLKDAGTNSYTYGALRLPSRAGTVEIFSEKPGAGIYFSGGVSIRCNTVFKNIGLYSVKALGAPTQANYALGNYALTLDNVDVADENGSTLIGAVSGAAASGRLEIRCSDNKENGIYKIGAASVQGLKEVVITGGTALYVSKTCNISQIRFEAGEDEEALLSVEGALTTKLIYQTGAGDAVIQKPVASVFTLSGDAKEKTAVIRSQDAPKLCVQLMAENCQPGTKVLTCPYLDIDDFALKDGKGMGYTAYQDGNNLMLGSMIAGGTLTLGGKELKYTLSDYEFTYSGREQQPQIVLKDGKKVLEENTDYEVSYKDNINAGIAKIVVTGVSGDYQGTEEADFIIRPKSLTSNDMEVKFSGAFMTAEQETEEDIRMPEIQVDDNGREPEEITLTADKDYAVSYSVDTEDRIFASVSGMGNYRGRTSLTFAELPRETLVRMESCTAETYNAGSQTLTLNASVQPESSEKTLAELLDGRPLYLVQMDSAGQEIIRFLDEQSMTEDGTVSAVVTPEPVEEDVENNGWATKAMKTIEFRFRSAVMNKYALAVIGEEGYQIVSKNALYIENMEDLTRRLSPSADATKDYDRRYSGYYEDSGNITSKKGMQGNHDKAGELGIQSTVYNILLNELIRSDKNIKKYGSSAYIPYKYKGETYYFLNVINYLSTVYNKSQNISFDLLLGYDPQLTYLIHPKARSSGHSYYTLNMQDKEARETFEALFCYLGDRFGGTWSPSGGAQNNPNGEPSRRYHVSNWILGNEVNCCRAWNYSGNMSLEDCVNNYAEAFQLLYQGVKRTWTETRVFISLDHDWNVGAHGHGGRAFLDQFAKYMYETAPEMRWNVNYHPYSQPLTRNDFWNDRSNTTDNDNTPYISMRNLDVLNRHLENLEEKYDMDSKDKTGRGYIRIILGEQGFTATRGNTSSERSQAAALGYSYYLAVENKRVDAMVNRAYKDDPADGINLGIMDRGDNPKLAYGLYKNIDGYASTSLEAIKPYLSLLGFSAESWEDRFASVLKELDEKAALR